MKKMPQKNFRWLSKSEISDIDWKNVESEDEIGYFVECTLQYPSEIREDTKDFPLCSENRIITYEMLSSYQKQFLQNVFGKSNYNQKKLTATFLDRVKMYDIFILTKAQC